MKRRDITGNADIELLVHCFTFVTWGVMCLCLDSVSPIWTSGSSGEGRPESWRLQPPGAGNPGEKGIMGHGLALRPALIVSTPPLKLQIKFQVSQLNYNTAHLGRGP
ncbi:hypothetical protein J6590_005313 [Homalodisca vitripennis]|nr:hypothetical protein J6590_005313 [Homalodisca vitripennis]